MEQPIKSAEERIREFAMKIAELTGDISYDNGVKLGNLIKREMDREFRRGYTMGLSERKR